MKNGTINWAIVGLGEIVRKRSGAAIVNQRNSQVYACVTASPEARRDVIDALAPRKVFSRLDAALADDQIDAVYIATPVHLHAAQAIAALEAGKDVLIEKPMAATLDDAQRICRTTHRTGRRLAVAYFRRHWQRFQLVADMLNRGDLGQIVAVNMLVQSWYRFPADSAGSWRADAKLSGGGILSDVGCHKFDLLAWWFGMPQRVVAHVATRTHSFNVEDSAAIIMNLSDGTPVTTSFHWNSKTWIDEIHVIGTEARLTFRPSDGDEVWVICGTAAECRKIRPPDNPHGPLIDDFALSIVEDRPPRFGADDGLHASRILHAVYRSNKLNAWVDADK